MLPKLTTMVFNDCLLTLWLGFLLRLPLSCLDEFLHDLVGLPVLGQRVDIGEEVAAGGLSGPMLSGSVSVDKVVKLAKLLLKILGH